MLVDIYKNRNTASKTYGQYYGRVFARDGLNLKGFAKHLSHHGKLATYEMMVLYNKRTVPLSHSRLTSIFLSLFFFGPRLSYGDSCDS